MTAPPTLATRVRVNDDTLFQDLQGEGVLLNLKNGVYFGLDPVGTRVWQLIETRGVLSEVLAVLLDEFDVPEQRCTDDLLALVTEMETQGLVTLG